MYEQFLSIATLKVVKCSSITIFDREIYQENQGQKYYRSIEIIHPFYERNFIKHEVLKPSSFLFEYGDIRDFYPYLLKRWYNEPLDIAPIRAHLINSLEKKRIYSSVDFLNIIQAIEGFWWRFRDASYRKANNIGRNKKTSLNTILNQLILEYNGVKVLNRKNIDIESVVDSRHYYSHFVNKSTKPHTLDGWKLIDETKKLRLLLLCCVLTFMGFEVTQIDKVFDSSHSHLLK